MADLPQICPVVYGAKNNEAVAKDSKTRAAVIETGMTKSMRLEYILSCQLQGSPPKLRIAVMSSIDPIILSSVDDIPSEQVADIRRNEWPACSGIAGRYGPDYALFKPEPVTQALLPPPPISGQPAPSTKDTVTWNAAS